MKSRGMIHIGKLDDTPLIIRFRQSCLIGPDFGLLLCTVFQSIIRLQIIKIWKLFAAYHL